MSDIVSRPYKPLMACERCVWHKGEHAEWCPVTIRFMGMTVIPDQSMAPGTIRLQNAVGSTLGTIVNVGPWSDIFAGSKEP